MEKHQIHRQLNYQQQNNIQLGHYRSQQPHKQHLDPKYNRHHKKNMQKIQKIQNPQNIDKFHPHPFRSQWMKLLKLWGLVFLILGTLELGLRTYEKQHFIHPSYEIWGPRADIPYKIDEAQNLFQQKSMEERIKIVIVGDSRAQRAYYSEMLDNLFENKTITYNLALSATGAIFQSFLIQTIVLPILKPDILIWDTSFNDYGNSAVQINQTGELMNLPFNHFYNIEPYEEYHIPNSQQNSTSFKMSEANPTTNFANQTEQTEESNPIDNPTKNPIKNWIQNLRLYKYRELFQPTFLNLSTSKAITIENEAKFEHGFYRGEDDSYEETEIFMENHTLGDDINPMAKEWFYHTINLIDEQEITFFLVHPAHNHEQWVCPELQEMFEWVGNRFIDLNGDSRLMDESLYWNKDHLNVWGAEVFTSIIYNTLFENIVENGKT